MLDTYITQSEWYQEIIERGERRAEVRMAQRALEGRFGVVPQEISDALNQADEAILEAIVLHITTGSLDEVRARLGSVQP